MAPHLPTTRPDQRAEICFDFCTSTSHGDIFCSRSTTSLLKERLKEKVNFNLESPMIQLLKHEQPNYNNTKADIKFDFTQGLSVDDLLSSQVADDDDRCLFSSLSVNPQSQLCLRLNRPLVMAMTVCEVVTMGTEYGHTNVSQTECKSSSLYTTGDGYQNITLVNHLSRSCGQSGDREQQGVPMSSDQSTHASCGEATPTSKTVLLNELSLNEGRTLLVLGLVLKLLQVHGHSVSHYTDIPQVC